MSFAGRRPRPGGFCDLFRPVRRQTALLHSADPAISSAVTPALDTPSGVLGLGKCRGFFECVVYVERISSLRPLLHPPTLWAGAHRG